VKGGASIAAFREYFPKAKIYGIDVDPHCKVFDNPSKNIFVEIMSQTDEAAINAFLKDTKFDIILDDASHVNKFTIASYNILNNRIKSNGLYIIEDLGCAYFKLETEFGVSRIWPGMSYNTTPTSEFNNDIADIHELTNSIITKLDNGMDKRSVYSLSDISYVHRYKYIMIICKN
jgi:23S rRNA U2552 (ribose-2'-O)-methylase RlmE/FtsJ